MVQAPSRFRPDRNYGLALKRRNYVLDRMVRLGFASEEQADAARGVKPELRRRPRPFEYPHYCDYYISRFRRDGNGSRVSCDVTTPLEPELQRFAQECVRRTKSDKGCDVAVVVRRVSTGEVTAMAVSADYFADKAGQVNTALAPRSAGSTLKPFLAAFAIDGGIVSPGEMLLDIPRTYNGYVPSNFDAKWRGAVSLDDSLVLSLNMPFVRLLEKFGVDRFGALLRTAGLNSIGYGDARSGLGMAIGNVTVTLEELTLAYARLARAAGGSRGEPFSPESAYLVSEILSSPARSMAALGHIADVNAPRFAWKTGTSSAFCDAWTVAWNPDYVIGVWCGHKRGGFGDKTLVGAKAAAPVCRKIARQLYPQNDGPWYVKPASIKKVDVCSVTGEIASQDCPRREKGDFISGASSPRPCGVHRRVVDGRVLALDESENSVFKIISPEDGAKFQLVDGGLPERIVFRVLNVKDGEHLWWFVDGVLCCKTEGLNPFVYDMAEGCHTVVAVNAAGDSSKVDFEVLKENLKREVQK